MCCHKKKSRILNSGEGACSATKCYMPPVERHWTTGKQRDGTPKLHGVYTSGFSYPACIAAPLWEVRFRNWPHRMVLLRRRRPALTLSLLSISLVQTSLYMAVLLLRIRLYSRLIRFGVISSLLTPFVRCCLFRRFDCGVSRSSREVGTTAEATKQDHFR